MKNQTRKTSLLLIIVATIAILFSACCKEQEFDLVEKEVQISGTIKGIIIEGPWEVVVTQDSENNSATIQYNVPESKIRTELRSNGYLFIRVHNVNNYNRVKLKANIKATELKNIEGSGATIIYTYGEFDTSADIILSGASKIDGFSCKGEYLSIDLSGASRVKNCTFTGNRFDAMLSGSSNANFRNLEVEKRCKVNGSGASRFDGSGYAGETSFTGSGSSFFHTFDLESEKLDIDLSGASLAEVTVNQTITGRLSGASTLKYKKATDVRVSTSGGSKVIPVE
ncbi:MAG: DUF2807 domain-containing protein [Lentimicrobiaceae bacterium]|nr:DUF2807 domain-containing protein [Lentimicrobiaceae bacterium]